MSCPTKFIYYVLLQPVWGFWYDYCISSYKSRPQINWWDSHSLEEQRSTRDAQITEALWLLWLDNISAQMKTKMFHNAHTSLSGQYLVKYLVSPMWTIHVMMKVTEGFLRWTVIEVEKNMGQECLEIATEVSAQRSMESSTSLVSSKHTSIHTHMGLYCSLNRPWWISLVQSFWSPSSGYY